MMLTEDGAQDIIATPDNMVYRRTVSRARAKRWTLGYRSWQLCVELANMGGESPSKHALYSRLSYHGRPSNLYGSSALNRAMEHGLIQYVPKSAEEWRAMRGTGKPQAVELTALGREIASQTYVGAACNYRAIREAAGL